MDTPRLWTEPHFATTPLKRIRYWELRRLLYNFLLFVVVVLTLWPSLPSYKSVITIDSILWLFLLAVLANVAYCAAYLVDIFVQASAFRAQWQQFRWLLFTLGAAFAAVLTRYLAITLFAAVGSASK
jgi:hypothetical protein